MGGHYAAESVVSLERNEWSLFGGIRNQEKKDHAALIYPVKKAA